MPAVVREGDPLSTGHGCDGTTVLASTLQPSVFANGILVAVVGTPTVSHTIPSGNSCVPHVAFLNSGSPSVTIGGVPVGRVGDSADAGAMTGGSPTITAS